MSSAAPVSSSRAVPRLALRMDDVGASSKQNEIYARRWPLPGPLGDIPNWLFLKYVPPFRAWGPYDELDPGAWVRIVAILREMRAVMTVAVTAAWVEADGSLVPFTTKFPAQADLIKSAVEDGLLEIANHGLTHCVLAGRRFLPRAFSGNRTYHREFWNWIPAEEQRAHLERAQEIFREWLGSAPVTLVPPGNVFGEATLAAARAVGLRVVSCATAPLIADGLAIVGNDRVEPFHDRDVVLGGVGRLRARIRAALATGARLSFVRDLAAG